MTEVIGKCGISAKIVLDSISAVTGDRLTTMEITYPRFILAEFNTHRCLTSDTRLYFDLPSGAKNSDKRSHTMSIGELCRKWNEGAKEHKVGSMVDYDLSGVKKDKVYSAKELADLIKITVAGIRTDCRKGRCIVQNPNKERVEDFLIKGADFIKYRENHGVRKFDLKKRLSEMKIRMYNEKTKQIEHTTVTDCWEVGNKSVYLLKAGKFHIKATEDHLILTDKGWKELQHITKEDKVITQGRSKEVYKDASRFKKINGKWVSKWNKEIMPTVSERQDALCFDCKENGKLEIHHVIPVSEDISKAFDVDNVVGLHQKCHKKRHTKQGWQDGVNLCANKTQVESVEYVGEETVYDLSVASDFHNFIANGIVVHNCFSRNSASSRAIPFAKMQENLTAVPTRFGQANKGMQDTGVDYTMVVKHPENCYPLTPQEAWQAAGKSAQQWSEAFHQAGFHKQIFNRLIESHQMMKTVVSATEWANFFWLRDDDAADPSIAELARCMKQAYEQSVPQVLQAGQWHLPYLDIIYAKIGFEEDLKQLFFIDKGSMDVLTLEDAIKVSCARACAVSFRNTDYGLEKSKEVYERLISDSKIHGSALEHAAKVMKQRESGYERYLSTEAGIVRPMPSKDLKYVNKYESPNTWEKGISHADRNGNLWSGNFKGFIQHRKTIKGENYDNI